MLAHGERLLCYSFCEGGLSPYAIDESLPCNDDDDDDDVEVDFALQGNSIAARRGSEDSLTTWQVKLGTRWTDYNDLAQVTLRAAREVGLDSARVVVGKQEYVVDFTTMWQRNTETNTERPVREIVPRRTDPQSLKLAGGEVQHSLQVCSQRP